MRSWQKWLKSGPTSAPMWSTSITVTCTPESFTSEDLNAPPAVFIRPQEWVKMSPGPWQSMSTSRGSSMTYGIVTSTNWSREELGIFRYELLNNGIFSFKSFFFSLSFSRSSSSSNLSTSFLWAGQLKYNRPLNYFVIKNVLSNQKINDSSSVIWQLTKVIVDFSHTNSKSQLKQSNLYLKGEEWEIDRTKKMLLESRPIINFKLH